MLAAMPAVAPLAARWGLLANRDFRRLWLVGFVVFTVRWLETIVIGVFVYRATGSAFDVALMTLLRLLPMALFGAPIGAVAERLERRRALVAVISALLTTDLCLAALASGGRLAVWHLALASFLNGIAWAADNPVRRVMIGEAVGPDRVGAAMSIDVGANNASRMLGPTVGGLLFACGGIAGVFTLSVLCYAMALAAALGVHHRNAVPPAPRGAVLARVFEGFLLVRGDPRLIGTLVVTVIYNVFGWSFTSLIPVIGQDSLHLGAGGIGVLAGMDGIGAFCGALALALYARPAQYARLYIGGVFLYLVMLVGFALAPNVPLAGAALLTTGVSNAAFSVMQATLVYLAAPPAMRSRMYGVLAVCIGSGLIGFFGIGVLADAIGAPAATATTGLLGIVAMIASRPWWRALTAAA
ncbi:MAG TPA: MFS transporter [Stellaceae bacterium]|nr:MFS transporter [Stellaceae bacterium]